MDIVKVKIVLVGGVSGKSCIIQRFCQNRFDVVFRATVGSNYYEKNVNVDGKVVKLEIWDTSSHERFLSLLPVYLRGALRPMDGCSAACSGLGRLELEQCPLTKHMRRLASSLNLEQCRQVFLVLGLAQSVLDDLQYQFQHQSPDDLKFSALIKWKETHTNATFTHLQEALENCEIDKHCLCQVFRDVDPEIAYLSEGVLRSIPSSKTLVLVSNHVGNSSLQLAIELDFEIAEIQNIQYQFKNKLLDQTREILKRWRNSHSNPTTRALVKALYRIGKIGCLREIFF